MQNKLSGRQAEQELLLDMLNSQVAEFAVLYGRRRVGKSFLIETFFEGQDCLFFHVTGIKDGLLSEQIGAFTEAIGDTFYNGANIAASKSWMDTFSELSRAINNMAGNKKVVMFIDELPWLCTKKSRLLQSLDYYWNRHWKNNKNIKLIVCGSSASWIIRKIIHHKGGLHNRNTRTILLKPFTLHETEQFFLNAGNKMRREQIMKLYMCTGGIPFYLNHVVKGKSADELINKMAFQETGVLYNEFDKLFDSLFDDASLYKDLIRLIAQSRPGMLRSEIEKKIPGSKGGTFSERLKDLEDAAFIKSFISLGNKRQGIYYRISDEYCYFYLKWIEPTKKQLITQETNNSYWSDKIITAEHHNWMGYAFEAICYKHIGEIRRALDIHAVSGIGVWRYIPKKGSEQQGTQIDLLFERYDDATTLCEIKCSNKPFVIDKAYAQALKQKLRVYQERTSTDKQLYLALISAKGVKQNTYAKELVDAVVTLDDLFQTH